MTTQVYVLLLMALSLSLLLSHLRHRCKITAQIEEGAAAARSILDSSVDGIVTTSSSGKITQFNLAAERIFGYKAENVIGKYFLFLLPGNSHKTHKDIMSDSRPSAASSSHELVARRADDTLFPMAITVKPINENGSQMYVGMFRDNSKLKQAEADSHRGQNLMKFLLQTSPAVFYTCSVEGGFPVTYISQNVEELFGYQPETITGASAFWPRFVHPDDFDELHPNSLSHINEGRENIEYRLRLPDGSYRWISDNRVIVKNENGEPEVLIGCWTDIHEKREMENTLSLREERLRVGLRCSDLTGWDWEINTGEITWSGLLDAKSDFGKQLPVDFDEFTEIAHPEDYENLLTAFRQCMVNDESLDIEYRIVWPDESVHWIHLKGELINDDIGSPVRMAGVLSDISDQKHIRAVPLREVKLASV